MPRIFRLRAVPEAVLKKAKYAEPPGRVPKGYFDNLLDATKTLLDRGFTLATAADWLIEQRSLPYRRRSQYINTMHVRFSRFRAHEAEHVNVLAWRSALGYDAAHAVDGGIFALCGARSARWMGASETQRHCTQCVHQLRVQALNISKEN